MKKLFIFACLFGLMSIKGIPQDTPKVEIFAGYSRIIGDQQGINASVTGNFNKWFGAVADFSHLTSKNTGANFEEKISGDLYLFGPQFSYRGNKRITPFTRVLVGVSNIKARVTDFDQSVEFSDTNFSYGVGGGLDIRVTKLIAVRAIQADYIHTKFFSEGQHNGRLSFGVVFRFGNK